MVIIRYFEELSGMVEIQKWGVGAAPFKQDTLNKNNTALKLV